METFSESEEIYDIKMPRWNVRSSKTWIWIRTGFGFNNTLDQIRTQKGLDPDSMNTVIIQNRYILKAPSKMLIMSRIFRTVLSKSCTRGVTKRCRLSWLTNSALVYEPTCGGGGSCGVSVNGTHTAGHKNPNKLWRSNSILHCPTCSDAPPCSGGCSGSWE